MLIINQTIFRRLFTKLKKNTKKMIITLLGLFIIITLDNPELMRKLGCFQQICLKQDNIQIQLGLDRTSDESFSQRTGPAWSWDPRSEPGTDPSSI
ncbi:unnamed protein product [Rhizophagus irregularis]|nr:unnamed protein product [Rhizophagus irregularis]